MALNEDSMSKILVISSQIHRDLAERQLSLCLEKIKQSDYHYHVEIINAGSYEIPAVINLHHQHNPFDAYIALGLLINKNLDHFDYVMSNIKTCFTHFTLNNIIIGNGIISGESLEELSEKLESQNPCSSGYVSAFNAVDCLINLKNKLLS